jgi:hypothetical protein
MRTLAAVLLVAIVCPSHRANADERYFVLFFAHQTPDTRAEEAHTYAEFIRAEVQEGCAPIIVQRDTISWLPCTGVVRLTAVHPETGHNFTLDETLDRFTAGKQVFAWGPYQLTPNAYRLAMNRKALLESGELLYRAIDVIPGQTRRTTNCIHAVAEIDPDARRMGQYNIKYGEYATKQAIRHYVTSGFLCGPCTPHDEIWMQLGLDGRGICRRNDWEPTGIGKVLRPHARCNR